MDVLYSHAIAGPHYCTGVSALVYVFEDHANPARALLKGIVKFCQPFFTDVGKEGLKLEIRHAYCMRKKKGPEQSARGLLWFGPVALNLRAQFSTRFELDNVLSCDGDGLARLRVSTLTLSAVRNRERAESNEGYAISLAQCSGCCVYECVQCTLCVCF